MKGLSKPGCSLTIPALGIDVGYAFTKGAFGAPSSTQASAIVVPSHAPLVGSTSLAVASGADSKGVLLPTEQADKMVYVGSDVMYYMGPQAYRDVSGAFPRTATYRALIDGILWLIAKSVAASAKPEEISSVTVGSVVGGLPMNTLEQHREFVVDLMRSDRTLPAIHPNGDPIVVRVRGADVIPQPLGTQLFHWAESKPNPQDCRVVTLDLGGGTFDWFTTENKRPVYQMCDSHGRGVLACAMQVAESIEKGLADDPAIVSRLEMALSTDKPIVRIAGREVALKEHIKASDLVLHECVTKMVSSLGGLRSVDELLLTGGGAQLLHRFLLANYAELGRRVVLMGSPQMANAQGFLKFAQVRNRRALSAEAA